MKGSQRVMSAGHTETPLALPGLDLAGIVNAIVERVVEKLRGNPATSTTVDEPLLLTVEQTAFKLGRTVPAVEHLIRKTKLRVVRIDRRISIDYRDILALIEQHKRPADI